MAKAKRVSIKVVDEVMSRNDMVSCVDWNGVQVTINKYLDFDSMISFVSNVVNSCFPGESGEYRPEIKDFAIRLNIIKWYSNVSIPENVDHQFDFAMKSGLVDVILENINKPQFNNMVSAIDRKISHIAESNISELNIKFNNLIKSFESFYELFGDMFSDVSADDIANIAKSVSGGGLDYDKMVSAISGIRSAEEEDLK